MASFDGEKCTDQFTDCLKIAIKKAKEQKNLNLTPIHFAYGLFSKQDSFGAQLLNKVTTTSSHNGGSGETNFDPKKFINILSQELTKLPSQTPAPSSPSPNNALHEILDTCEQLRVDEKSSFISVDHGIIALYHDPKLATILNSSGLNKTMIIKLIKELKRGKPTMNRKAEEAYDALNKYARNLTTLAAEGKLDPVIGRSAECTRVIQIMQRKQNLCGIVMLD